MLFRVFDVQIKPTPLPCRSIYAELQFQESYYKGVHIKTSCDAFRLGEASITKRSQRSEDQSHCLVRVGVRKNLTAEENTSRFMMVTDTRLPVKSRAFSNVPSQISA